MVPLLRGALLLLPAVLAGCAGFDRDRALADADAATRTFTGSSIARAPAAADRQPLVSDLLARPLGRDDAVRLALANSPALQALLAERLADQADAVRSGRLPNPVFTFERLRLGDELEIGRLLSFGLVDLVTWPQRAALSRHLQAQAATQLAGAVVDQVSAVRQSWVRAVAAQQLLAYAQQVQAAADASADLAQRMQQAGNFSKLQRARQQAFQADAATQLATAQHAATATREALVRQLGLDDAQAARLTLPERLPDLPAQARPPADVSREALQQRLDVRLARDRLQAAGAARGVDLLPSFVDVEAGVRRDSVSDAGTRRGWEADIRLPLFDGGDARRASLDERSRAAALRYDATVRAATSQLREAYSGYRTAWQLARQWREGIVPLRQSISEENLLRYNGMQIGVFELLADTREQVASVMGAIRAEQQFWLADAALSAALIGQPLSTPAGIATPDAAPASQAAGH